MRLGRASGNDAENFFLISLNESMNDLYNRARSNGSNRYPTFLIIEGEVTLRNSVGVIENQNGSFKANIVLPKILPVLVLIPLKSHRRAATEIA